jgi:hypothetical protein
MTVADLIALLRQHDPSMRVLVAEESSIFGALPDDLQVVDYSNAMALLVAPREMVESRNAAKPRPSQI